MTSLRYQNQLSAEQREKVIQYFLVTELLLNPQVAEKHLPNLTQPNCLLSFSHFSPAFKSIFNQSRLSLWLSQQTASEQTDIQPNCEIAQAKLSDLNLLLQVSREKLENLFSQFKQFPQEFEEDLASDKLNQYGADLINILDCLAAQLPFSLTEINSPSELTSVTVKVDIASEDKKYLLYQTYVANTVVAKLNLSQLFNAHETLTRVVNQWLNQQSFNFTEADKVNFLTKLAQRNYADNAELQITPLNTNFTNRARKDNSYSFATLADNLVFSLNKAGYSASIARPLISNLVDVDLSPLLKQEIDSLTNRKRGAGSTNNYDHEIKTLMLASLQQKDSTYQVKQAELKKQSLKQTQSLALVSQAASCLQHTIESLSAGINFKVTKFLLEFAATIAKDCEAIAQGIRKSFTAGSREQTSLALSSIGNAIYGIIFPEVEKATKNTSIDSLSAEETNYSTSESKFSINSTPKSYLVNLPRQINNPEVAISQLESIKRHWRDYANLTARKNMHTNLLQLQRRVRLENIFVQAEADTAELVGEAESTLDSRFISELKKLDQESFAFYIAGKNNFAVDDSVNRYYQAILTNYLQYLAGATSYRSDLEVRFVAYHEPESDKSSGSETNLLTEVNYLSQLLSLPDLVLTVTSIYTPANLTFSYQDTVVLSTPETFKRVLTSGLSSDNNELNLQVFLNRIN